VFSSVVSMFTGKKKSTIVKTAAKPAATVQKTQAAGGTARTAASAASPPPARLPATVTDTKPATSASAATTSSKGCPAAPTSPTSASATQGDGAKPPAAATKVEPASAAPAASPLPKASTTPASAAQSDGARPSATVMDMKPATAASAAGPAAQSEGAKLSAGATDNKPAIITSATGPPGTPADITTGGAGNDVGRISTSTIKESIPAAESPLAVPASVTPLQAPAARADEKTLPATEAGDELATAAAGTSPLPSSSAQYSEADRASLAEFQRSAMQLLRDNAQLQSVVLKVQAHDRTLHTLVGKTAECPKVVWFYPKKPELRDWLSNPMKCLLQAPLMMLVVCPVTFCVVPCGPDGVGWEVAMPKKWVKEWGPAILFSIYVLQAAVVAGRVVGIPLPPMPDTMVVKEALGLKGMWGSAFSKGVNQVNLSDSLSCFADITKATLDLNPELQFLCEGLKQPIAAGDGGQALPADLPMHLVGEAYKSIHKFLLTFGPLEDQLRGRMERVMAPDGDVEWVSVEGKQAWLMKHEVITAEETSPSLRRSPKPSAAVRGGDLHPARVVPIYCSSTSWLSVRMQERGFTDAVVLAKLDAALVSSSGEGFTTEASLAVLRPDEFHVEYLQSVGITARGTAGQLVALHRELHAQYTAASSPTPSTSSAAGTATLTPDEKARILDGALETRNTVQSLTAELKKLRATTAASSQQQQSGGGGGGKGGLMQKQAQCNVVNPRTGQPYSMDELVAEIHLLQQQGARNADDIAGVAAATREGLEGLGWKG
jgi:hypothetical protein